MFRLASMQCLAGLLCLLCCSAVTSAQPAFTEKSVVQGLEEIPEQVEQCQDNDCVGRWNAPSDDVVSVLQVVSTVSHRAPLPQQSAQPVILGNGPKNVTLPEAPLGANVAMTQDAAPAATNQAAVPAPASTNVASTPVAGTAVNVGPAAATAAASQASTPAVAREILRSLEASVAPVPAPAAANQVAATNQAGMTSPGKVGATLDATQAKAQGGSAANSRVIQDALNDAATQKAAVSEVMKGFASARMGEDEDSQQELEWAKAEQQKEDAEWKAAADVEAAEAQEGVVNWKASKRSEVLQNAAFAKSGLTQKQAENEAASNTAVRLTGTDAAWKAFAAEEDLSLLQLDAHPISVPVVYAPDPPSSQQDQQLSQPAQPAKTATQSPHNDQQLVAAALEDAAAENAAASQARNAVRDWQSFENEFKVDSDDLVEAGRSKRTSRWKAATDVAAASAVEEAANFKAWEKAESLKNTAFAKHAVKTKAAEFAAVQDVSSKLKVVGADAAKVLDA